MAQCVPTPFAVLCWFLTIAFFVSFMATWSTDYENTLQITLFLCLSATFFLFYLIEVCYKNCVSDNINALLFKKKQSDAIEPATDRERQTSP